MRKQRFFTLITAAVLTLTAVPALPASAAAPSFAGKISAAADGPFFSPGFDWEKYSTMNCAVTNPALNQERSQCGLLVHLSQPDTDLFLVTRYTDWRPATENRKAGQIRINTRAYDVYSYPPGTSSLQSDDKTREYWCVPMTSPDDAESTVRFQLDEILEQLTQLGLPAGKLEEIKPFAIFPDNHNNYSVDTPSDSKVTADFQVKTPSKDNVRLKYGSTDNEFSWELYQAPESGTAWIAPGGNHGFTAEWAEIEAGKRTLFDVSKQLNIDDIYEGNSRLTCSYKAKADITAGQAEIGITLLLKELNNMDITEVRIIDAWAGARPSYERCGSLRLDSTDYDIYKTVIEHEAVGSTEKTERTQYLIVRQKNLMPEENGTEFESYADCSTMLEALKKYGLTSKSMLCASVYTEVQKGSGTVTCTEFSPETKEADQFSYRKTDDTADCYFWTHSGNNYANPSELKYDAEGKFTGKWEKNAGTSFVCGKRFETPLNYTDEGELLYSYEVTAQSDGTVFTGITGTLPGVTFYIIEGKLGSLPEDLEKVGMVLASRTGGKSYVVFKRQAGTATQFYSVCSDSPFEKGFPCTIRNTVNVSEHLKAYAAAGMNENLLESLAVFAEAGDQSTGNISFTRNRLLIDRYELWQQHGLLAPYFPLGKTVTLRDTYPENSAQTDPAFLVNNFNLASLEYYLTPEMVLSYDWKPGQEITCNLDVLKKQLMLCEDNQLPVIIGPFISSTPLPSAYYKDENGKYLTPEKMEEHIDSIIKSIFTALKKEYPDLKIAGCIVVADQFNYESANQKPLEEIYGKNNKDYILSTFKSARKYAPSSCKLYLEDLFFARENSMKEVCDCVKSIREHGDYIDGIAMNVLIFENWKDESAFFDAAVRDIKALGQIDLILTDTAVSVSPAYDSEALCRCYTAGFFDFFRNAKDISAVILRDNDRMLDGPLCLCEVKGFADSLRDAINQYQSLPAKTVRNLLSPYFKTGKTITMPDTGLDESGVKDYVRDQFDLASLEYLLTLESCLSYTWKAGDPIKIEFNSLNKDYLSYCEKNRIPVVIGPLLSPAPLPLAYYKDADGALVSAEEMDARMKIIISSFFTALSENYPDLIIEDCIVCADLFNSANGAERPLETIYGKDNTDYIINTFKLTKQYAPNGCRLYLQDIFLPVENSMTKTCALAKKILAASDTKSALIDGIAMCVGTTTAEAWKTEAAYFDAAVKEIAAANMNLILTDVSVSVRPAYDDDARCAAFTACFTDIIRQAKNISAVILEDHHQMLDGPRTLSHLKGFGVALQNAVDAQAAVLPEQKSGDANCDGSVDVSDAVIIARFIAEDSTLKISSQGKLNADADRNATLDGQDVIYVLKVIAKLI